jgi:hypothetical protein
MSAARLHIVHDGPYPVFARPALLPRSYGVCALSHPDHPHEAELDDNGICALLAVLEFGRLIAAWQGGIWT